MGPKEWELEGSFIAHVFGETDDNFVERFHNSE